MCSSSCSRSCERVVCEDRRPESFLGSAEHNLSAVNVFKRHLEVIELSMSVPSRLAAGHYPETESGTSKCLRAGIRFARTIGPDGNSHSITYAPVATSLPLVMPYGHVTCHLFVLRHGSVEGNFLEHQQ
jgi:hypothetical protein